jgi:hypothetical protein
MEKKICRSCKKEKPKTKDFFRIHTKNYFRPDCKVCLKKPKKPKPTEKICSSCKKTLKLNIDNFRKRSDYDGFRSICKSCFDEKNRLRHKKNYKENTDKEKKRLNDWIKNNLERRKKTELKSRLKPENIKKRKERDIKNNLELPNHRVANTLGVKLKDLTLDIIETQRLILKIKRELNK